MQTYILFEKVRGSWVKLGEYDDPTTLASMAYHLGALHGNKPVEIKVETIKKDLSTALRSAQDDREGGQHAVDRTGMRGFLKMGTVFEQVTADPSTLAANMVKNAHESITAWAARRGIKAEFTTADFLHDVSRMEAYLRREATPVALFMVSGKEVRDG